MYVCTHMHTCSQRVPLSASETDDATAAADPQRRVALSGAQERGRRGRGGGIRSTSRSDAMQPRRLLGHRLPHAIAGPDPGRRNQEEALVPGLALHCILPTGHYLYMHTNIWNTNLGGLCFFPCETFYNYESFILKKSEVKSMKRCVHVNLFLESISHIQAILGSVG